MAIFPLDAPSNHPEAQSDIQGAHLRLLDIQVRPLDDHVRPLDAHLRPLDVHLRPLEAHFITVQNKNRNKSAGPFPCPFACWLALLTHSLALHCMLRLRTPLRLLICTAQSGM